MIKKFLPLCLMLSLTCTHLSHALDDEHGDDYRPGQPKVTLEQNHDNNLPDPPLDADESNDNREEIESSVYAFFLLASMCRVQ